MKKKKTLLLIISLMGICIPISSSQLSLYIVKDGVSSTLPMKKIQKVLVSDESFIIENKDNSQQVLQYQDFDYLSFIAPFFEEPSSITDNTIARGSSISVYPNPTPDYLYIEGIENQEMIISLYNLKGLLIKSITRSMGDKGPVNLSDLEPGVYFCKIQTNNSISVTQIIKK